MADTPLENLLTRRAAFLSFVHRRVSDRELAEDIVQAAYMRALDGVGKLRENESAAAWFYSVLRNAVIDHYRRRATEASALERFAQEYETSGDDGHEPTMPAPGTRHFVCGCIEQVLPALRPAYADILRSVDLDETPLAAYASAQRITAGNATVRIHRARAALRKELARFCGACTLHACLNCVCKTPATTGANAH